MLNKSKYITIIKSLFLLSILINSISLKAAHNKPASLFDKMNYQEVLEIRLKVNLTALLEDRRSQEDYKATLNFVDAAGVEQVWSTEVALRGKFRRMKCAEMPPLKLKFKKGDLAAVGLSSSNDLKLVTQCVEDEAIAKELLLKEYLTYKLYNQITDASYRVQLVKVTYKDISTGEELKQWAFLIEDTAQLRARFDAEKCEKYITSQADNFDENTFKTMALFQYMIGNADWDAGTGKNVKNIKQIDKRMSIPYDFDFAAVVDAPYASVNSKYKMSTKMDRIYLGFDDQLKDIEATFQLFENKKEIIFQTIKDFKLLSTSSRREMTKYLETFFEEGTNIRTRESYLTVEEKI